MSRAGPRLDDLRVGQVLVADPDVPLCCMAGGEEFVVKRDDGDLVVECALGLHDLALLTDPDGRLVGLSLKPGA